MVSSAIDVRVGHGSVKHESVTHKIAAHESVTLEKKSVTHKRK